MKCFEGNKMKLKWMDRLAGVYRTPIRQITMWSHEMKTKKRRRGKKQIKSQSPNKNIPFWRTSRLLAARVNVFFATFWRIINNVIDC